MVTDSLYKSQEEKILLEADSGLFDRSRQKSSRSKADLLEILVTINLRDEFKLNKEDLIKEFNKIRKHIGENNYKDENVRIDEQQKRANLITKFLIKKISEITNKNGFPTQIDWVGRKWQDEGSVSDIDITFKSSYLMGFSIKSTRNGFGTQRNIGKATSIRYLNLDIDKELKIMIAGLRKELFKQNESQIRQLSSMSLTSIKNAKYKFPIIQIIGKKLGEKVQKKAVEQNIEQFNQLSRERKLNFVSYLFGLEKKPITNVICVGETIYFCENSTFNNLVKENFIASKSKSNKGFYISSNKKNYLRIQVNFTNGLGLSPFCERAFLVKETKKYFVKVVV